MTSYNVNHLLKGPISKYGHMGVRAATYELGKNPIQAIAHALLSHVGSVSLTEQ